MIAAFLKAAVQFLSDPRLWGVLVKSLVLSLVALAGLWWGLSLLMDWLGNHWPWWQGWMKWGSGTASLVAAFLLLPVTYGITLSFFQERVADVVEERHYPQLGKADGASIPTALFSGLRFFALLLVLNLAAAPIYLVLLVVAGSGAIAFLAVNGILCGREYYDIVALRRLSPAVATELRKRNRISLALAGTGIVCLGLVPGLNLVMPAVGIAVMVHVVQALQSRR